MAKGYQPISQRKRIAENVGVKAENESRAAEENVDIWRKLMSKMKVIEKRQYQ